MRIMRKNYDIRKIEELHRLRADMYEEYKHMTTEEMINRSNEAARKSIAKIEEIRRQKQAAAGGIDVGV